MNVFRADRYERLRALLRGPRVEADVGEEFEAHLRMRAEAYEAEGMGAEQARAEALRRFGDRSQFAQQTVAIDHSMMREQKRMLFLDTMRRELKQSARGLARARGFTAVAGVTLALGLGASTAVFTLLDAIVLNPLPYTNADRLVRITHPTPGVKAGGEWETASATYYHYTDQSELFEKVGAYAVSEMNARGREDAFRARVARVTAPLFDVLGARPAVGRLIEEQDDRPDAPLVVLGHDYWQREFGGDAGVVGQTLELEGSTVEVIGVTARGFALPDQQADLYIARGLERTMRHANWHHLRTVALLQPGISAERAQRELLARQSQLLNAYPDVYSQSFFDNTGFTPKVQDLQRHVVGSAGRILWIVLGAVGVVLAIACANVANLILVRHETRRNERSVRVALGAERVHLTLQSLSESLLLTLSAGALGLWLAALGLRVLLAIAPSALPRLSEVGLNFNAALFGMLAALLVGLVFGCLPLLQRRVSFEPLRESGRGLTTGRKQLRIRALLVSAQLALALVLLAAGGLILRSFYQLRQVKPGITTSNVLVVDVSIPFSRYRGFQPTSQFWRMLTEKLGALPGVVHAGAVDALPLESEMLGCAILWTSPFAVEGEVPGCIPHLTATPGYFEALGMTVRGRTPTWSDVEGRTGAVVITKALADRLWPGEDAIGRGIRGNNGGQPYYRIVGVLNDVRAEGLNRPNSQMVFFPTMPVQGAPLWSPSTALSVVIRTRGSDPLALVPQVRRTIAELDRSAALGNVRTMEQVVSASMARTSFIMVLLGISGVMALLISVVGLYGVVSYLVSRRRAEIGIRMALGARAEQVRGMVVREALQLGAVGVLAGLIGALFLTRTLESLLFEVAPTDPLTLGAVAALLLLTCAVASYLPARRAARVSPSETLRSQN